MRPRWRPCWCRRWPGWCSSPGWSGRRARFGAALAADWQRIRALARVGLDLFVRTAALRVALLVMTMVATRLGSVDVSASEIALAIWSFLAMGHDSLAIAAQALVGRQLGAGRADDAQAVSHRLVLIGLAVGAGMLVLVAALHGVLPELFSNDPAGDGPRRRSCSCGSPRCSRWRRGCSCSTAC